MEENAKAPAFFWASFVAAPALFLCIALLASYLPGRRATRVNPVDAIK